MSCEGVVCHALTDGLTDRNLRNHGRIHSSSIERRIVEIGMEIFERAVEASPRAWQRDWWLEQMTRVVDSDARLKAAVFQFVDCLPTLADDAAIARHLWEYLTARQAPIPRCGAWILDCARRGGPLAGLVGRCAHIGARMMAGRFVTGHDAASTFRTLQQLRHNGLAFTLDVLGESTTSHERADAYVKTYLDLMTDLCPLTAGWPAAPILDDTDFGPQPRVNISIKLTGLDPHFDPICPEASIEAVCRRLRPLLRCARELSAFLNIDIESFKHRTLTFDLFESVLSEPEFRDFPDVGIVVQAYLRDGEHDLARMIDFARRRGTRFAVRLVKGAYWDSETTFAVRNATPPPVWTRKWESDACYERMARDLLEARQWIRPCFASHNVRTIAAVMGWAERLGAAPTGYEFQMLYGMGDPLKQAVARMGRCVRVYAPCGDMIPGMAYLIRRLLENTSNDSFLKQGFRDRTMYDRRLADPASARPSSAPLPRLHYSDPPDDPAPLGRVFRHTPRWGFVLREQRERMMAALKSNPQPGHEHVLLIAGQPVSTESRFNVVNPARPSEVLAVVHLAGVPEADMATAAAVRAWPTWRDQPAMDRCRALAKWADVMEQARAELAAALVKQVGMLWREADAEIAAAIDYVRLHAQIAEVWCDGVRRRGVPGEDNVTRWSPKGVCVIVSDIASPLAFMIGTASAAIAAGNVVIAVFPAQVAASARHVLHLATEAGTPFGVLTGLPVGDESVALHLAQHGDVRLVAAAGSGRTCQTLHTASTIIRTGQRRMRTCLMEWHGDAAMIIDDDADVDAAVGGALQSAFRFAGQARDVVNHVIAVGRVYETFVARLREAIGSLRVGDPADPTTHIGPVIDATSRDVLQTFIEREERAGRALGRGRCPIGSADGYFVEPILLSGSRATATGGVRHGPDGHADVSVHPEAKGPLLWLSRAESFQDAVRWVNDLPGARIAGVYSRSPMNIEQARRLLDVSTLFINRPTIGGEVDRHPLGASSVGGGEIARTFAGGIRLGDSRFLLNFFDARTVSENTLRHGFAPDMLEAPEARERTPSASLEPA